MRKRIIIAGGGTGGHIFPAIAIANALRKQQPSTEILFIGAKGKMEMEKVPQAGYTIKGIDIAGFNRSSLVRNIALPYKLMKSLVQVSQIVKEFKPDAAVGFGGYSTFPVLRYAQSKGIATFIHESNSFAGRSNIMLGRKATKIFAASDGMEAFFPADKIMITGNPVRSAIVNSNIVREEAIQFFGLDPAKTTILVTGGSLGAKSINEAIAASIDEFLKHDLQLIWQTGKPFAASARKISEGRKNIWTNDFIAKMEYAFAAADTVVSRSGAMAIAELCVVKKPAVFAPYPFAAEDHQTANAKRLVEKGAAVMISDSDTRQRLVPVVIELAEDKDRQQQLKKNISKLAVTNADEVIATEIFKALHD